MVASPGRSARFSDLPGHRQRLPNSAALTVGRLASLAPGAARKDQRNLAGFSHIRWAPNEWKEAITTAQSEDVIKVDVLNDISPIPGTKGFPTIPRSLPTAFLSEWSAKREEARRERDRLRGQIVSTTQAGRQHECILWAGQTAGGISEILPVATIMRRLIAETEAALSSVAWGKQMRYAPTKLPHVSHQQASDVPTPFEFPEPDSLGG